MGIRFGLVLDVLLCLGSGGSGLSENEGTDFTGDDVFHGWVGLEELEEVV